MQATQKISDSKHMPILLKTKKFIDNDVCKVMFTLETANLPESDKELLIKFGEPKINIGGNYLSGTANAYTLPNKYIRIKSDLPFTQEFDAKSETSYNATPNTARTAAQAKAVAFQTAFTQAYTNAFTTLRAYNDTFTSESITNI